MTLEAQNQIRRSFDCSKMGHYYLFCYRVALLIKYIFLMFIITRRCEKEREIDK